MDMGRVAFEGYYAGQQTSAPWESLPPGTRESFRAAADAVLMFSDLRRGQGGKAAVGLNFGDALAAAVGGGAKITRAGWNAPGQYVVYQKGYPDGIPLNGNTAEATGLAPGTVCVFAPYMMIFNAQGVFVPWLASQGDLLAVDWETVVP